MADILSECAFVEFDALPGGLDAIAVARAGERPRVIVSQDLGTNRMRFTLAHELGHIRIPWQVGTAFCHTSLVHVPEEPTAKLLEDDANDFASEFLLPGDWLEERLLVASSAAQQILDCADEAQVSPQVVALACAHVGFAVSVEVTKAGDPPFRRRSSTCHVRSSHAWDPAFLHQAAAHGATFSESKGGTYTVRVLKFPTALAEFGQRAVTARSPEELLVEILRSLPRARRPSLSASVNGVVGATARKADILKSESAIFFALRQAFLGRENLARVTSHAKFPKYLQAKARTLAERRR